MPFSQRNIRGKERYKVIEKQKFNHLSRSRQAILSPYNVMKRHIISNFSSEPSNLLYDSKDFGRSSQINHIMTTNLDSSRDY
jgi:hypothetical protein